MFSFFFFLQASPPAFCPEGRTHDLHAILSIISQAQKFVYVSVMEYFPTSRFMHPKRYDFNPEKISYLFYLKKKKYMIPLLLQ